MVIGSWWERVGRAVGEGRQPGWLCGPNCPSWHLQCPERSVPAQLPLLAFGWVWEVGPRTLCSCSPRVAFWLPSVLRGTAEGLGCHTQAGTWSLCINCTGHVALLGPRAARWHACLPLLPSLLLLPAREGSRCLLLPGPYGCLTPAPHPMTSPLTSVVRSSGAQSLSDAPSQGAAEPGWRQPCA